MIFARTMACSTQVVALFAPRFALNGFPWRASTSRRHSLRSLTHLAHWEVSATIVGASGRAMCRRVERCQSPSPDLCH